MSFSIFLNFRGEDTRNCFTCHLYEALHKKIETFIDDGLEKGDGIWPTLKGAIEQSKISVVIFSKDYASSKWCLRELVEIMERKKMHNQIVIPVFYKVKPSDIRWQTGSFKDSFDKHGEESQEEVQKWKEALTEASNLFGWDSSITRLDTTLVDQIVKDILKKLMGECTSHDYGALIGHKRIEEVLSLLSLHVTNVQIIGIWGMGGIGKTTIADAIFNKKSNQFEGVCFIQNVRESLQNSGGLVSLRKEILSQVLKDEHLKVDSPTIPSIIKERLNRTKVLIVLDDVNDYLPLENLARGVDRLGLGSRIIITSRDKQVLHLCGVNDQNIYEVEGFNYHDALQLFCNYAFHEKYPPEDRTVLSNELVNYSKGNPLALKVLGSSLYLTSKQEWESVVNTLRTKNLNRGIFNVLKFSYDGLEDSEKNTFLDIVCFFKGEDRRYVETIIGDCSMELGALIKKSLITISHGNIEMHDLLEEMGREIVVKESPNKPGKRSRLWRQEEVQNILKYDEGTNAVQGIVLDLLNIKDMQLSPQAFKKMYNLRFLKFDSKYYYGPYNSKLHFPNGLSDLSSKLRSLIWHGFPLTALPSNFNPENLVELHLRDSSIERLWEGTMHAPNLKLLILRGCKHLTNIPNLSDALLLERIDLKCCQSLLDFPLLAPHLKYLHFLDLQGCKSLRSFPSDIHFESLTSLELNDHANLTKFPEISGDLILLDLSGTAIDEVPPSIGSLTKLSNLNLSNCTRLKRISIDIFKLNSLCNLNLSNCSGLESFPGDISHLSSLIFLDLSGSDFESLPKSMNQLSNLKELEVNNCNMLQSLTELPLSLELLSAIDCKQLRSIPDASELVKAKFIFTNCRNLEETAVGNILATVEGYEGELYSFTFCCPGSEVPEWFSYRSNKSYIDLRMARQDCFDGLFPGFIACAVIEFEEYCSNDKFADELCVLCSWYESGAFIEGYESDELNDFSCTLITGSSLGTLINSDHVALWYCKALDRQVLESEYTDITFEFWLAEGGNCRVISCGVRPIKICGVTIEDIGETSGKRSRTSNDHREEYFDEVSDEDDKVIYAEPIKTSGVTIEDIGETSGKRSRTSNDHREEEVEPHSKRLNLDLSL